MEAAFPYPSGLPSPRVRLSLMIILLFLFTKPSTAFLASRTLPLLDFRCPDEAEDLAGVGRDRKGRRGIALHRANLDLILSSST